jgi:hypothetical protein
MTLEGQHTQGLSRKRISREGREGAQVFLVFRHLAWAYITYRQSGLRG